MGRRLKDTDIRAAAKARMLRHALTCPDTLVIDELGLEHGASRVDIAVVNGHLRGLEIKAEADTLERLPRQIAAYGRVVDMATLVVSQRHVSAAISMLPAWWGVVEVSRCANGAIAFRRLRPERVNRGLDLVSLARLLWRSEAIALLEGLGLESRQLARMRRADLYDALVANSTKGHLRGMVRATLKARVNWRDRAQP